MKYRRNSSSRSALLAPLAVALPVLAMLPLLFCATACHGPATGPAITRDANGELWAECPICRFHCDLACLRVAVRPDAPHADVDGETYYFCSEECRCQFVADSRKYLAH